MHMRVVMASAAALAVGLIAPGPASATAGPTAHGPVVVAKGLDNPRGLAWGKNGALLVAEAGRGGPMTCVPGVFSAQMCLGATGALTQIDRDGTQHRVLRGLPSLADPATGGFAFGPSDVSSNGKLIYLSIGGPANQLDRSAFSDPIAQGLGSIQAVSDGHRRRVADLAAYELAHDPDQQLHESNGQSVLWAGGKLFAVDAAGNTFFRVVRPGHLRLLETFPNGSVGGVEFQAVPDALAQGPDGAIYISTLTGVPFPDGQSKVWRWTPAGGLELFAAGFTSAIDLAFGPDGSLYVLEIFTGRVVRVSPHGKRTVVVDTDAGLSNPTGLAIGKDGAIYVSNCGVCAGTGTVVRFSGG